VQVSVVFCPYMGCVHNQQSGRSDLLDEIDPVQRKRACLSDFITVMHTITLLLPIIPQSLWLVIWNRPSQLLRHMPHGRGLEKSVLEVRFFSDASEQIWIWLWMNLSRSVILLALFSLSNYATAHVLSTFSVYFLFVLFEWFDLLSRWEISEDLRRQSYGRRIS